MICRFFDIIFSFFALLLLSPVLVVVIIILKLSGEGEVLFRQERVGKEMKIFQLLKFATMKKNSPFEGAGEITVLNDPRVLPVGKFLRKSKLNEIPQLLNVIKGEMSLVGPRPLTPNTFNFYSSEARKVICSTRPGITGVASILFRDEEQIFSKGKDPSTVYAEEIAPKKQALEVWWVKNGNIYMYLSVILCTAVAVLLPKSSFSFWLFTSMNPGVPR